MQSIPKILKNQQRKINAFEELLNEIEEVKTYNFISKKSLIENLSYYYGTKEEKPNLQMYENKLKKLANKIGEIIK